MSIKNEIERKLQLNEYDLLFELGNYISGKQILPKSRDEVIGFAKAWLSRHRNQIRLVVCKDEKIKKYLNKKKNIESNIEIAAAIADLIGGIIVGISPITVAVLVIKRGLKYLCEQSDN